MIKKRTLEEIGEAVARATQAYKRITVRLGRQNALVAVMEEMRLAGLQRELGEPAEGMIVSERSGAGKTTAAEKLRRMVAAKRGLPEDKGPVRIVRLSETGTPKSFWSSILEGLGDPHYGVGSETTLKKRVRKAIEREGVELLVIDELNHTAEKHHAAEIMNGVKNMLSSGLVPVVAMGTSEELKRIPQNDGLEARLIDCPGIAPMRWPADAEAWTRLLGDLDAAMVKEGLVLVPAHLSDPARAKALCEITSGIVGRLKWLMGHALRLAVRRGGDGIELADLIDGGYALLRKYPRAGAVNPLEALR